MKVVQIRFSLCACVVFVRVLACRMNVFYFYCNFIHITVSISVAFDWFYVYLVHTQHAYKFEIMKIPIVIANILWHSIEIVKIKLTELLNEGVNYFFIPSVSSHRHHHLSTDLLKSKLCFACVIVSGYHKNCPHHSNCITTLQIIHLFPSHIFHCSFRTLVIPYNCNNVSL